MRNWSRSAARLCCSQPWLIGLAVFTTCGVLAVVFLELPWEFYGGGFLFYFGAWVSRRIRAKRNAG